MEYLSFKQLRSGGLITNYYCSSTCKHCLYRCSPHWPRNYCSPSKAFQIFKTIHKFGCSSIHIGGGESFLNPETLVEVLGIAQKNGIRIEYIETNASWFTDSTDNHSLLKKIRELDVSRLMISISPFHNEFTPFNKVKNLISACNSYDISNTGWMWDFFSDIDKFDNKIAHTLEEYTKEFGEDYIQNCANKYNVLSGGRALELYKSIYRGIPLQMLLTKHQGGCSELSNVDHFHIDLFGNYIPGLCAGLSIRMEDLGMPIDKINYPLLSRLHSDGINGLFDYVRDVYGFEAQKPAYISKCELCNEIRTFLINEEKILSHEIRPYEHYTN